MRNSRKLLYLDTTIARGRRFKEDAAGGATGGDASQGAPANNSAGGDGNSDATGVAGGDSNNNGQQFNPAAFWDGSGEGGDASSSSGGESAATPTPSPAPANQGNFAQTLQTQLDGLSYGEVFDAGIAEEIGAGNFTNANKRMQEMVQKGVKDALSLNISILKPFAEQLLQQVSERQNQTFQSRDDNASLIEHFPAAKNPVMAKTIQPIYAQALQNNRGDRVKAVQDTKEMLRYLAGESASDLGLDVAPRGQGDYRPPSMNLNWLDELTERR